MGSEHTKTVGGSGSDGELGYFPGKFFRSQVEWGEIEKKYGENVGCGEASRVYSKNGVATLVFGLTQDEDEMRERRQKVDFYRQFANKSPWITYYGTIPEGGFQQKCFPGVNLLKFIEGGGKIEIEAVEKGLKTYSELVAVTKVGHGDVVRPNHPRIPVEFRNKNEKIGHLVPNNFLINGNGANQEMYILDWGNSAFLWPGGNVLSGNGLSDREFIELEFKSLREGLLSLVQ